MPYSLTEPNKFNRVSVEISLLLHENEPFLDIIFIGDEKWIVSDNVWQKQNWEQAFEYEELVAKALLHPMKVLLSIWWVCREMIHFGILSSGKTVSVKKYYEQKTNFNTAILERRPILENCKSFIFHYDKAACCKINPADA